MSKWINSDTGILRKKSELREKKELFVFGYTCKLFWDNEKALHIDQGKYLIPWMGDETLKIDRYDARAALHDLSSVKAPSGGYDWKLEFTNMEIEEEKMCNEERYRALHTDEDEEEMYREEELKRLNAADYSQVGFNYDNTPEEKPAVAPVENDKPFVPTFQFAALFTPEIVMPETQKQNSIIEKTAKFIASEGIQMEILLRVKQKNNPQFDFLNKDASLHPYYLALINLVNMGMWPQVKRQKDVEEKHSDEEYLHPTLSATVIESAPSIPSIRYNPSADCDYTMLISKMKGEVVSEVDHYSKPPPSIEPTRLSPNHHIANPPVVYMNNKAQETVAVQKPQQLHKQQLVVAQKSTGLSLMKNYDTYSDPDSDSDDSSLSGSNKPQIVIPPQDIRIVIDKMAAYVARNGDEFAEIVLSKCDPRFTFLEPNNIYHAFYNKLMQEKRASKSEDAKIQKGHNGNVKFIAPVSFTIKKVKETDHVLPKPALLYESSSDEETENRTADDIQSNVPDNYPRRIPTSLATPIPPPVLYKVQQQDQLISKYIGIKLEATPQASKVVPQVNSVEDVKPIVIPEQNNQIPQKQEVSGKDAMIKRILSQKEPKSKSKESTPEEPPVETTKEKTENRQEKERERYYKTSKKTKDKIMMRSRDRQVKRANRSPVRNPLRKSPVKRTALKSEREYEKERDKRRKMSNDELLNEIISIEEKDDIVDLTGDVSDTRRRVAAMLRAASSLPHNSLGSAIARTLEALSKKRKEEANKWPGKTMKVKQAHIKSDSSKRSLTLQEAVEKGKNRSN